MKNFVSINMSESRGAISQGWDPTATYGSLVNNQGHFCVCIPLSTIFGFAEDYKKIIVHARQKLILRRSNSDENCYQTTGAAEACNIKITHISWYIPFVVPGDLEKLELQRLVDQKKWIQIPYRSWELFEYTLLPQTSSHTWSIKSYTQLEKPRFVIVGFQTERKDNVQKSASEFDTCKITDMKLFINEERYPYNNMNINFSINHFITLYRSFIEFRESYYGDPTLEPYLTPESFKSKAPLFVIDCSRQYDRTKTGVVDFRLEFTSSANIDPNTRAFALVIHDKLVEYNPFHDTVNKIISLN